MLTWKLTICVLVLGCSTVLGCSGVDQGAIAFEEVAETSSAVTAQQRLATCQQDPRVVAGLVSKEICAGADIFFRETFNGNGRTCGTCHPVANNTTLDVPFITQLHQSSPNDPLFVFETNPNLAQLETSDLLNFATILENVDGFQDPTHRFVSRSVSHLLSLATSIARDSADGTASPPLERTGWGGDGVGDGSLRAFLEGAVKQHFTKDLARRPNVDFRVPTTQEADLTRTFQLSLGRLNELNLEQVRIFDAQGEDGRQAFMDPQRGRCNSCHFNAGANFQDTGKNRNLDNGIRFAGSSNFLTLGTFGDILLADGGFGGAELAQPNMDVVGIGFNNGFGNATFSPPPLIEAADTAPFFHNAFKAFSNTPDDLEGAIRFYSFPAFGMSLGGQFLEQRFGSALNLEAGNAFAIARFLRILNGALNIDIAKQRLEAAKALANRFHDTRADIQKRLLELAVVEIDDALQVLAASGGIYPTAQERLLQAKDEIALGLAATSWSVRLNRTDNGISRCLNARDLFGSNITYVLGKGNLMF
jgi:cytochrome c peroxidase